MSSSLAQHDFGGAMKPRDPSDRGKIDRALAHAMRKQQEGWAGLANPQAVPDLMGSDYIDKVTGTTPKPRTFRLRRSRDVDQLVADIERIYHETGTSPAFLASIDYDDLQFLNDTVGMQVFGPLEQEMMKVLASRNYTKRVAALADYYYNQELARRELLEGTVQARALRTRYGLDIADPTADDLHEFEGFQYRTEDWMRAVAAAHQLDDFASNEN